MVDVYFSKKWNHTCYVQVDLENPRSSKSPDLCLTSMKCQQNSNIKLQVAFFFWKSSYLGWSVINMSYMSSIWKEKGTLCTPANLGLKTTGAHNIKFDLSHIFTRTPNKKHKKHPIIEKHPPWRLGGFWASSSSNPPSCVMPWSGGSCRPTTATAMRWCV